MTVPHLYLFYDDLFWVKKKSFSFYIYDFDVNIILLSQSHCTASGLKP